MTKKGSDRAGADVGLMLTAYNLRRIMNILGLERLRKYLKECGCLISRNMSLWKRKLDPFHDFLREVRFVNPESDLLVYRMLLTKTTLLTGGF